MGNPTVGEIPDHWEFTTLGDVCDRGGGNIQTGPFGSQLHASDYVEEGIPSIMPVNIGDNRLVETDIKRITEEDAQRLSKHLVVPGDIIYSRRGDVERRALVREEQRGWFCGTGCIKVRLGEGVVDPAFASFYLDHPNVREWIVQHAVGATMPNLNTSIMKAIPFVLPPPEEQRAIASILGALDDKIELNRRMNATLESLARAIFKSWFVDFDPVKINAGQMPASSQALATHDPKVLDLFPSTFQDSELGPIPEGWSVGRLDDLLILQRGFDLPKKKRVEGKFPVYAAGGHHGSHNEFKVRGPGIVTGRSGVLGNVYYVHEDHWPLNTTLWVKEFRASRPIHAFHHLQGVGLRGFNAGSAVPTLNRNHVHGLPSLIPPSDVVEAFEESVQPLFNQHKQNTRESDSISNFRDTLLPQLLSGELSVPAALTRAEEALA